MVDQFDGSQPTGLEDSEDLGKEFAEVALALSSLVFPPAALVQIFTTRFGRRERLGRARDFLQSLVEKIRLLEAQNEKAQEKIRAAQQRLETPAFQEAVAVALEESVRATNNAKINQFAAVLAGSLVPNQWATDQDIATLIRDIAQLGDADILVLDILERAFRPTYGAYPNLNGTNQFVEHLSELTNTISVNKIHPDDFYGTCLRLSGFGLATEDRPAVRPNGERCFRLTRRGLAMLTDLRALANETLNKVRQ